MRPIQRSEKRLFSTPMKRNKRVLIILPAIGIGDVVWAKPWIDEAIQSNEVFLMTKPTSFAEVVFHEHQNLNHIILDRSKRGERGMHDGLSGFFKLIGEIKRISPQEVWILHKSWRYAAAARLASISRCFGYGMGAQNLFLTERGILKTSDNGIHPRQAISLLMAARGIKPPDDHPKIRPLKRKATSSSEFLRSGKPIIFMGVGATTADRRWDPNHFSILVEQLIIEFPKCQIILCGSKNESHIGDQIFSKISGQKDRVDLIFNSPLEDVICLLQLSDLYVGNDSGLINLAAGVGLNCIRIYASSLPVLESKLIKSARSSNLVDNRDINSIEPETVLNLTLEALRS